MKSFYLDFVMNKEEGKAFQFIEELEEYEASFNIETEEGVLTPVFDNPIGTIYVDSTGGENRIASVLYDFLKPRKNNYRFVITGDCSSNAILLLLALNPKQLIINRQAVGTIHLSSYNHSVREIAFTNKTDLHIADYHGFVNYLDILLDCYKVFLTKEEFNRTKTGLDVYLNSERIQEVFKKLKTSRAFQEKCKNIFELTL